MLGLAFKPNTDDMREAPSIDIAQMLVAGGAKVRAYDPVAAENARVLLPAVTMFDNPYDMAKDSDALIVITEWNEFKQLDLERIRTLMKTPILFDGRNVYDPAEVRSLGFTYRGCWTRFRREIRCQTRNDRLSVITKVLITRLVSGKKAGVNTKTAVKLSPSNACCQRMVSCCSNLGPEPAAIPGATAASNR